VRLLSRRAVLRGAVGGAAVTLALPPLEAMFRSGTAMADPNDPIFGVFFWANGMPWHAGNDPMAASRPDLWTPAATGAGYAPSELLAPLAAHRPTVITGFEPKTEVPPDPPGQSDGHMRGFMVALTGDRIRPEGFNHPSHTLTALRASIDQVIARRDDFYASGVPRFRSIHVGASDARFHEYGHWNAISYNGPSSQNLPFRTIGELHGQLFMAPRDAEETMRRASLLSAVRADRDRLRPRLGTVDQQRLDEHFDRIADIERRYILSTGTCAAPPPPPDGDLLDRADAMARILAVAIDCDLTRVFTFMLTSPASTHVFSNLGVGNGMHAVCHEGLWEEVRRITTYQMQCFARVLDRLAEVSTAGVSVLDRSVIFGVSEYGEGWHHGTQEMPAILVGGGCGHLARGVHHREVGGNYAQIHLTAIHALGLEQASWGWNGPAATAPITGLVT
jgi:hypothetical protein